MLFERPVMAYLRAKLTARRAERAGESPAGAAPHQLGP
jgi:hypothetical protein